MAFKKGMKKIGGRAKGVPNKRRTIFESLEEIQTEDGKSIDVVKLFFQGVMDMPSFQRVDALLDFMKFLFPQQKALEIGNRDGEGFRIEVIDYTKK